jgi:N-acetylmuramoyl-L-alanine amidase
VIGAQRKVLRLIVAVAQAVALAAAGLGSVSAALASVPALVVVIDPGHGGTQEGARGAERLLEKTVALQISRRLRTELQKELGAKVFLTREGDTDLPLSERVAYANRKQPELFISIHANSMPTRRLRERIEGLETYFLSASASGADATRTADRENEEGPSRAHAPGRDTLAFILQDLARTEAHADSSRLAHAVHQRLIESTGAVDRGVQQAPFYVLNGLEAPAILVEVGYISHPGEGKRLGEKAYQQKLARGIAAGVRDFLEQVGRRGAGGEPKVATP